MVRRRHSIFRFGGLRAVKVIVRERSAMVRGELGSRAGRAVMLGVE